MKDKIIIFSDGSSRGNPGPGGYGAIVAMGDRVVELGGREGNTTNNRMELSGAIKALQYLGSTAEDIVLNTDSSYLINGITKWVFGWQRNNWQTKEKSEVLNKDLWIDLVEAVKNKNIKWNYVGGHAGIAGNERCDVIATSFADGDPTELFNGDISKYEIDLNDTKGDGEKKKTKSAKKNLPAYSYLSLINGVLKKYKTWAECEKDVKGTKGAKFEKAISADDEDRIMSKWGLKS